MRYVSILPIAFLPTDMSLFGFRRWKAVEHEALFPIELSTGEIRRPLKDGDKWNRINVLG